MPKFRVSQYVAEHAVRSREDFKIEFYRGTGKGGQNRNKVETCVRITDLKTGLVAQACEEREQARNREIAFQRLGQMIITHYQAKESELALLAGETLVIRTYRFRDSIVIDKRVPHKTFPLNKVLDGELDQIHEEIEDGEHLL